PLLLSFLFHTSRASPDLHSFPTRRSSDLGEVRNELCVLGLAKTFAALLLDPEQVHQASYLNTLLRALGISDRSYSDVYERQIIPDRKSTRLNSSHVKISYAVFCLKKKKKK